MPEFFSLPEKEQLDLVTEASAQLRRDADIVEKDVWICWALEQLTKVNGLPPFVFKGGTSLSKVFRAIKRFSEDVDVTYDCRKLVPAFDPFAAGASKTAIKSHGKALRAASLSVTRDVVRPHLEVALTARAPGGSVLTLDAEEDKLTLAYHSVVPPRLKSVTRTVVLEFGGRSSVEPNGIHTVRPDMAGLVSGLQMPEAVVQVLAPERTFWEKVTLIHAEIGRTRSPEALKGMSRHWHDVAVLADCDIGRRALAQRDLLEDVIRYKEAFYGFGGADYQACLARQFRLIPPAPMEAILSTDHADMASKHFFDGPAPDFSSILRRLERIEASLNGASPGLGS